MPTTEINPATDLDPEPGPDTRSADELIEDGVGMIALGLYRKGAGVAGNDPQDAYECGLAAVYIIRDLAFGFLKQAKQEKRAALDRLIALTTKRSP